MGLLQIPAFLRYTEIKGKSLMDWALEPMSRIRPMARSTATEAVLMIYVSEEQLEQVKYLLDQSAQGNHLLFDGRTILRIAPRLGQSEERTERLERAESLLEQMILRPTISSKKAFLEGLDPETYDDVARVYFNIVQNNAQEQQGFSH